MQFMAFNDIFYFIDKANEYFFCRYNGLSLSPLNRIFDILITKVFEMTIFKFLLEKMFVSLQTQQPLRGSYGVTKVTFYLGQELVTFMRAAYPMSLSVGVQPTSEGVYLKLASLVRIQNLSPLKTHIFILHEPRSMPQMTGVDFIITKIFKVNHQMLLILITISLIIQSLTSETPVITLYTHKWCPPCRKAITIIEKIKANYPQVQFEHQEFKDKTILFKGQGSSQTDSLPFPSIIINCSQSKFTYQNDLSVAQLTYWIDLLCLDKLPQCTNAINQELLHLSVQPAKDIKPLAYQMKKNPHIRICESKNSNYSQQQVIKVMQETKNKTMFLDYFTHNIRNYLIQSGKMAVALITNNVNTSKATSFFGAYLSLQDFTKEELGNRSAHIYNFNMKKQHKSQLVFLGLCYNSNLNKCVADDARKNQIQQTQKYIPKLLEFMNLEIDHLQETQYVVAFRFRYPKFQSYIYHQSLGILDEKFLFWLSEILQTDRRVQKQRLCLWNSLVHRISYRSLEDIQTYHFLTAGIQKMKEDFKGGRLSVNKIQKIFHNQPKFTLCLTGGYPLNFQNNKAVENILSRIGRQFQSQKQKEDDQL